MSKTLATIDVQAPITIGLEDIIYSGPEFDSLAKFYDEMDFRQFRSQLGSSPDAKTFEAHYTEVSQLKADMFADDQFFYFEILNDNYHTEDMIGFAWGNSQAIYASTDVSLLNDDLFKRLWLNQLKPMILSAARFCSVIWELICRQLVLIAD